MKLTDEKKAVRPEDEANFPEVFVQIRKVFEDQTGKDEVEALALEWPNLRGDIELQELHRS
jgi:hypothetical protein